MKLSEELSEDVLKIVKMDVDEKSAQLLGITCLSQRYSSKEDDQKVVKQKLLWVPATRQYRCWWANPVAKETSASFGLFFSALYKFFKKIC